jgi:hypothetical protein
MEVAVEGQEQGVHAGGEGHQQQCKGKDTLNIVQAHRLHQQVAEAALRAEHLAEQGADQGKREARRGWR